MERPTFQVELDDGTTHVVEVLMADQLRAELEAPRNGIPVDVSLAPVHTTALWVWSALLRTGQLEAGTKFQEFRPRLLLVKRVEAAPDVKVDPTQQGQRSEQP